MINTRSRAILLCAVVPLILAGCASPQGDFQTKKDDSYQRKLDKVLLVSPENEDVAAHVGRDFVGLMLTRVDQALSQRGVATEIVLQNKEDLDPAAPVKESILRFRPGQVLYIGLSRVVSRNEVRRTTMNSLPQFTAETSVNIAFNLVDVRTGKTVWRGTVQYYVLPNPADVGDQIVKQLEAEHLL